MKEEESKALGVRQEKGQSKTTIKHKLYLDIDKDASNNTLSAVWRKNRRLCKQNKAVFIITDYLTLQSQQAASFLAARVSFHVWYQQNCSPAHQINPAIRI